MLNPRLRAGLAGAHGTVERGSAALGAHGPAGLPLCQRAGGQRRGRRGPGIRHRGAHAALPRRHHGEGLGRKRLPDPEPHSQMGAKL